MREQILRLIDKNSKLTSIDLAAMLGTSVEEIEKELKSMEEEKVICGYTTLIDWDKTDSEVVTALIEVKVTPQRGQGFDKIAERIYKFDEVEAVYLMSGGYDLTVMLHGKTLKEVAQFVSRKLAPLEAVESTVTHFLLKKYKEHGIILNKIEKDERMLITP